MPSVAVFFGGASNESEVSVITGMLAVNLLRGSKYTVVPVYLPPSGGMATGNFKGVEDFAKPELRATPVRLEGKRLVRTGRHAKTVAEIDVALNCCHGGMGEDGTLAALLAWNGVPSASPDAPACGVFMDKLLSKLAAAGLGIPVTPSFTVREQAWRAGETDADSLAETREQRTYKKYASTERRTLMYELVTFKIIKIDFFCTERIFISAQTLNLHTYVNKQFYEIVHVENVRNILYPHFI